jgi:hypothetical protein
VFQELLVKIARGLTLSRIPYMIIGGQAVLLYGEPRLTKDIDITLGVGTDKFQDIIAVAGRLGLKILVDEAEDFVRKTMVLPVLEEKSGIRIDLIFSYSPYEQQAIERAKGISFNTADKFNVHFAALEDIVIHKIIAGRPRDIEDVKTILLKNPSYDSAYISMWLSEFDRGLDEHYLELFKNIVVEIS